MAAPPRVIVVGGGCEFGSLPAFRIVADHYRVSQVSGLSAAHTVYLNGGNVMVLDKQGMRSFLLVEFCELPVYRTIY